jgi:hypothetical protein
MKQFRLIGSQSALKVSTRGMWRRASVLALIVMELSWIVPAYQSLSQDASERSLAALFAVFAAILVSAYASTRFTSRLDLNEGLQRGLSGAALFLCAYLSLKALLPPSGDAYRETIVSRILESFRESKAILPFEFQILLAVTLLWMRGVLLAQRWIGPRYVLRGFQLGAVTFLVLGLMNSRPWDGELRLEVYLFLFAGLVAVASAHSASLGILRDRGRLSFDRVWVLSMVFLTILVVGLAVLLGSFASGTLAPPCAAIVRVIVSLLLLIFLVLISPLLLLLTLLLPGLLQRLEALFDIQGLVQRLTEVLQKFVGILRDLISFFGRLQRSLPDLSALKPFLLWSMLLGLFVLLLRWIGKGRFGGLMRVEDEDQHESLLERGSMLQHLGAGLRRQVRQLAARLSRLRLGGQLLAAARIRRIYVRMVEMAAALDHPRREAQTPREYLPTLIALFPGQEADVRRITEAYNQVRYGELSETRTDVAGVEEAWRRVLAQGRERLKAQHEAREVSRWTDIGAG